MQTASEADYLLTILQHNYCADCMWLKGKITDIYHASSLMRGEDSKNWRINIMSPYWERGKRALDFPRGFTSIDVPALKLEMNGSIVIATQNPALIDALLVRLKSLLASRQTNEQIRSSLEAVTRDWRDEVEPASCKLRPEVFAPKR